jgi:hypothetical protein
MQKQVDQLGCCRVVANCRIVDPAVVFSSLLALSGLGIAGDIIMKESQRERLRPRSG